MERLHKGAKWKFRVESYFGLILFYLFFFIPFFIGVKQGGLSSSILWLSLGILLCFILIAEVFVHLSYKNWGYEFAHDSLKIEKGVIVKKYKSIPYERIQNVDVTRGIVARIIGFSTIDIQTAGYSAYAAKGGMGQSEGHIPAVSMKEAEKIREFLVKKITGKKQGL